MTSELDAECKNEALIRHHRTVAMRVQDLALNLESGVKEPLVRQIVRALAKTM